MPLCQLFLLFLPLVTYAQNWTVVPRTNITRSGSGWTDNSVTTLIPNAENCSYFYTKQIGDSATFKFTGTDILITGNVTVLDRSNGRATVDGSQIPAASGPASTGIYCNDILWTKSNLTNTEHTVVITSTKVSSGQQVLALSTIAYAVHVVNNTQSTLPSPKKKNVGAIAGGAAAGGAVAVGLLILAFLNGHNLSYLFNSLAFALFGWLLFSRRSLIFTTDKDVGPVEITLFLSPHEHITDSTDDARETLLTWQVIKIGHSRRDFTAFCPCVRGSGGETKLGFGTVEDTGRAIRSPDAVPAPTAWTGEEWTNSEGKDPVVKNNHEQPIDVALGTYEQTKRGPVFRPFLRIKNILHDESYPADTNLYLHAFVTNGYEDGQYDEKLVAVVKGDMLTKRGIPLNNLKPITEWRIRRRDGKLVLKYVRGSVNKDENGDDA